MKKFGFVALFALIAFVSVFAATGENTTGSIALSGTIAQQFTLSLTQTSATGDMKDDGSLNKWELGTATVMSNYKNWTISVSTLNKGKLVNGDDSIDYTFNFGDLLVGASLASAKVTAPQARTLRAGNDYAMAIEFKNSTANYWQAGTWTDTVTLTIEHN
jgi:hypothetical protein